MNIQLNWQNRTNPAQQLWFTDDSKIEYGVEAGTQGENLKYNNFVSLRKCATVFQTENQAVKIYLQENINSIYHDWDLSIFFGTLPKIGLEYPRLAAGFGLPKQGQFNIVPR